MIRRVPAAATAFLLILLALAGIAPAQERDWNRFRISLGTFIVDYDTTVRVDSPSGRTTINLEDDLGLDSDHTETVISARYRFARRHSIGLGYLNFDRASRRFLEQDVQFGDDLFTVGLNVETSFEFDLLNFDYRYALIQKPNFDFSFSIGINMVDIDLGLRAELQPGPGVIEEREEEVYPVPSFGLGVSHRVAHDWAFRSSFGYFAYSTDDWEADLFFVDVHIEYFPWKNFGFGLGYNYFAVGYDEEGDDPLDISYEYDGIFLRALFEF